MKTVYSMSDEVTNNVAGYRAATRLLLWAQRLGIEIIGADSWGQLATLVSERMGGKCLLCEMPAANLGFWIPEDPSLFDGAGFGYLHCGSHSIDEIEARIAEKHARTS